MTNIFWSSLLKSIDADGFSDIPAEELLMPFGNHRVVELRALFTVQMVQRLSEAFIVCHDGVSFVQVKAVKLLHVMRKNTHHTILNRGCQLFKELRFSKQGSQSIL